MNNAISSNKRLIISGDILELYDYKQPYFYNWIKGKPTIRGGTLPDSKRKDNIQRSMATIRRLIHCNQINQTEKPKFLTLTYRDDIKELDIANPHFSMFTDEIRRTYGDMEYIAVPEFQPISQRVHYHALYFNLPFINNFKVEMARLWPHGTNTIEAVRSMKAMPRYIGKYMTKSLGDKRTIGRKSYFTSRNLHRPIVIHDQKRATDMLEQWKTTLNRVNTRQFTDYRGRDVTYHIFEGASDLTANLRAVQSF